MTTVILCNGREPEKEAIQSALKQAELLIAADGGADVADRLGLKPDLIIGDLDSYSGAEEVRRRIGSLKGGKAKDENTAGGPPKKVGIEVDRPDGQTVIYNTDQDTNDLEKALDLALERQSKRVLVFGATGMRIDHTLKNLSVLKKYADSFDDIRFVDNYGEMILLSGRFKAELPLGTQLSLFPLSGRVEGIRTRGLKYPLNNEFLENGIRDGTSNESIDRKIEISHEMGDLLLFIATKPDLT